MIKPSGGILTAVHPDFPRYYVTSAGSVCCRGRCSRAIAQTPDGRGYLTVTLTNRDGRRRTLKTHILVMEAFLGRTPAGYHIDHHDHNKANNAIGNLAWRAAGANSSDCDRSGNRHRRAISDDVRSVVFYLDHICGWGTKRIADALGIGETSVRRIKRENTERMTPARVAS